MGDLSLWAVLAPILLVDLLNPVLLAAVTYALGTQRAIANASAIILGHTATYFAVGIGLALGIESLQQRLQNPEPTDFAIEIALGVILLGVGFAMTRTSGPPAVERGAGPSPWACFGMGAVINLIGIPFAVPYFGAIGQILKADLSAPEAFAVLGVYNLLYPLPFAAVVAARAMAGERADEPLRKLTDLVNRAGAILGPGMLLLLGAAFLADGVWYFLRGQPLFPV